MQVYDGGNVVTLDEKEVEGMHQLLLQLADNDSKQYQEAWQLYER